MDFPLTLTSYAMPISAIAFAKPDKIGVAVGISLITCIQAEVYDIFKIHCRFWPPSWSSHFPSHRAASPCIPDLENMGVSSVGIALIAIWSTS